MGDYSHRPPSAAYAKVQLQQMLVGGAFTKFKSSVLHSLLVFSLQLQTETTQWLPSIHRCAENQLLPNAMPLPHSTHLIGLPVCTKIQLTSHVLLRHTHNLREKNLQICLSSKWLWPTPPCLTRHCLITGNKDDALKKQLWKHWHGQ